MDSLTDSPRPRSDSMSSSASQGSKSRMLLHQRLSQLLTCIEDMSSDDEASEEVSRTLDEAFQLCGRFIPTDVFRLTHVRGHSWRPLSFLKKKRLLIYFYKIDALTLAPQKK